MSTQPQWVTAAGSLGSIPEGIFYQTPIQAVAGIEDVHYALIAGQLPAGIQLQPDGLMTGVPKNLTEIEGVPTLVLTDITSKFAVRAYTVKTVDNVIVVDRIADRTFTLTITGVNAPEFITPPGNVGTYYDGTPANIQINFTNPTGATTISLLSGELPPGLTVNPQGLISGLIQPLIGPGDSADAGFDSTPYAEYAFDFSTRSTSKNYQFSLIAVDGKETAISVYEIYVYSKNSMSADTIDFTADNTFITADIVPTRTPVLITPVGDLGTFRSNNFFAYKFDAVDFDGDPILYEITVGNGIGFDASGTYFDEDGVGFDRGTFSLPPGLVVNENTGWFYGYIPDQGATETTYRFAIRVKKENNPSIISDFYYFTMTITGATATDVVWITPSNLGTIDNGAISNLSVEAISGGGYLMQYKLEPDTRSKLPQGLKLMPSGNITGTVSFNTFALDGGTTTFDKNIHTRTVTKETTFDTSFTFTVNAFSPASGQTGFQIESFTIINLGINYTSTPTIVIDPPPSSADAIQAAAGPVSISGGHITNIDLGNAGLGYTRPPNVTVVGGGGSGAKVIANMVPANVVNLVSSYRTFTLGLVRAYNQPYQGLYIKAMPPQNDRTLINQLVQNQDIIPVDYVYRADDPNFGVASNVVYNHAFGLNPVSLEQYVAALNLNHYWKNLTLGTVEYAQARDSSGTVIYEVVYSRVVDNLVNNAGESVSKQVKTAYPVQTINGTITTVYPNSLVDMRTQVIDSVGQISPLLPQWMMSKQANGKVLGFTPAWVIAYVKPGFGAHVVYNIKQQFGNQLNTIDFKADRYEIDRRMTYAWDSSIDKWLPTPPAATTFDLSAYVPQTPTSGTIFDGGATDFITPANTTTTTDAFDRYLMFPKTNILG